MNSSSSMSLKWCTSIVFLQARLRKRAPNHNRSFQKKRGRSSSLFPGASSLSVSWIINSLIQNRAQLIIENARIKDNWSCDWLNVNNQISFDRLVMTYKIKNRLSPENLWDKFELRSVHSKYATTNCHDLQIPRLNTEHAKMALNIHL